MKGPTQPVENPTVAAVAKEPVPPPPPPPQDTGVSAKPIAGTKPTFPPKLLERGARGSVTVSCTVDIDGKLTGCNIIEVKGNEAFSKAVLDVIDTYKFLPATRNGKAVKEENFRYVFNFNPGE